MSAIILQNSYLLFLYAAADFNVCNYVGYNERNCLYKTRHSPADFIDSSDPAFCGVNSGASGSTIYEEKYHTISAVGLPTKPVLSSRYRFV